MSVAAVDDLHQATGRDLNLVVGDKYNATVGGDMQERIEGLRKSVAGGQQYLIASKTWMGSENINILDLLLKLIEVVESLSSNVSAHYHGDGPLANNSLESADLSSSAGQVFLELKGVTA